MNCNIKPPELRRTVVLVVDDEDVVCRFVKCILKAQNYEVLTASNSIEALHFGSTFDGPIDILLTDYDLKCSHNGMELAACFSALRPDTQVLLVSGSLTQEEFAGDVLHQDDWDFLPKPFAPEQLLKKIQNMTANAVPAYFN